jgi:hypothetical protein
MSFSMNDSVAKSVIVTEGSLRLNNRRHDDEVPEDRIMSGLDTLRVLRGRLILGFALSDISKLLFLFVLCNNYCDLFVTFLNLF